MIQYIKVTPIHYKTLSKKDTILKIEVNNLYVCSLKDFLLQFLDKRDNFANKNEKFYNSAIKKVLTITSSMSHELFATVMQARDTYPELKKYFYKEHSNVTWEKFLTKFELWIDTRFSTENTLGGSGIAVEKMVCYFNLKK